MIWLGKLVSSRVTQNLTQSFELYWSAAMMRRRTQDTVGEDLSLRYTQELLLQGDTLRSYETTPFTCLANRTPSSIILTFRNASPLKVMSQHLTCFCFIILTCLMSSHAR